MRGSGRLWSLMPRPYRCLLASQVVNRFGDGFYYISLSWLIYSITGSALALGGMFFAYTIAVAVVQAATGPLTDRLDRRRMLIWLDVARGLLALVPVALHATGELQPWHIYVAFVAVGILGTPYGAASGALMPQLVPAAALTQANAWLEGGTEAMYLIGPAVGGFFIAAFGAPAGLLVNALSFFASAALIALVRVTATEPRDEGVERPGDAAPRQRESSYLRSLAAGWGTLVRDRLLARLTALQVIVALTDTVFIAMVVPYASDALGSSAAGVGLLEASMSGGVIVASVIALRAGVSLWTLVPAFCVATGALGFVRPGGLAVAIALQVAAGLVAGLFGIKAQTEFQTRVENRTLGRTLMARNALRSAAQAAGALAAGAIAATGQGGVQTAFIVFGACGLLLSAVVGLSQR